MASQLIREHYPTLVSLNNETPKKRKEIIANAKRPLLDAFMECAINILGGIVSLTPEQHKKLNRYRESIRTISKKRISLREKKKIIQKGGFVQAILGAVLPYIASLIGKAIAKRSK